MGGTSSTVEDCLTHGPWGGEQGKDWIYMPEGFINKITIVHGRVIDRIRFQSDLHTGETQSTFFGGKGGNKTDTICIDYPNEHLTSISGLIGTYKGFTVVTTLTFYTNQRQFGPFGCGIGSTLFTYDGKGGVIVGFHGRAEKYIDAIGIYVMPKSLALYRNPTRERNSTNELCWKMSNLGMPREAGPWGAAGGKPWDDGVFSHVVQVRVYMGESLKVIYGIQFEYVNRDADCVFSQLHGRTGGDKAVMVNLDCTKEFLTGISGFYGPVEEFNGMEGITSLTFHTNKETYGPYGEESGPGYVYFTSTASPGIIVGFQGRNGDFLTAIGVHMEYL